MSLVLAFDTATPATVVAARRGDGPVAERADLPEPGARPAHAPRLLALCEEALAACAATWADVTRLGAGTGPGTFTGLRIGVATARALAQATGAPLAGVPTLEGLARGAAGAHPGHAVLAVLDARRGEAFAAAWDAGGEPVATVVACAPAALAELLPAGGAPRLAVGDGALRWRAELEEAGLAVPADGDPLHRPGGAALCALAAERPAVPGGALVPDYARLPDAEM
ncbi:MAG: tRNA (adenosine(37)-N6)-threonylcarbamoyltransferase complex dimerization subunit type 1 TsaB, partial [Solirubrobacteraceae bacterium]|nr:tRNA (adenosine(37)-N6)-threonylcarbamoyltransferase complex dimerization subunit type 1 TsaB [Solirubrobacteraceae bacterium]